MTARASCRFTSVAERCRTGAPASRAPAASGVSGGSVASRCRRASDATTARTSAPDRAAATSKRRSVPSSASRSTAISPSRGCSPCGPCRARRRTRRSPPRRGRPGASARARCRDPRGTAHRGSRLPSLFRYAQLPAAAFGDQRLPCGACTTPRAAILQGVAALPVAAVGLARSRLGASWLRALGRLVAQDGLRNETRRELAAPLGDQGRKFHVVLRFRVATRCASVPESAPRARRAVTSRQRGRSVRRTRPAG